MGDQDARAADGRTSRLRRRLAATFALAWVAAALAPHHQDGEPRA